MTGGLKHVLFVKFKDEIPPTKVDELITLYGISVSIIAVVKAFHWGKDVSIEGLNQGFTHVFEATFESLDDVATYAAHPAMVELITKFQPHLEKCIVIDYTPIVVKP